MRSDATSEAFSELHDPGPQVKVIKGVVQRVDRRQQQSRTLGFVVGVVKKFGDDKCSSLAALLTYYGFLAIFPLLLLLTTVLGFVGNDWLQHHAIGNTLHQFPVVGQQIGRAVTHPLRGSPLGVAVGGLGLLYGSFGVAQVGQRAMADVWNIPGVIRPGFAARLVRSLLFVAMLGAGIALATPVSIVTTAGRSDWWLRIIGLVLSLALDIGLYAAVFRVLTPRDVPTGELWAGAVLGGAGYAVLLVGGTSLVQHQLRHAEAVYGQFAFVLGLMGWLYLVSQVTLYAAEVNVVRSRRLWPRSLLPEPPTDADERVLRDIAEQDERRPDETVAVDFDAARER